MKTMISGQKRVNPRLTIISHYTSPLGGAPVPRRVAAGVLLFELITAGCVYAPSDDHLRPAGWVFVHGPGEETVWRSEANTHYECLVAQFEIGDTTFDHWPRSFRWDDGKEASRFAYEMLHAFHYVNVDQGVLGDLILSQLCYQLALSRQREDQPDIPPRIARVMAMIESDYQRPVGIDDLARQARLSPSHLHTDFKAHTGMPPHQYLIQQRMRAAQHLLATTTVPIKAVAGDVGYPSPEHFCRSFKRHCGVTAAAYRRRYTIT